MYKIGQRIKWVTVVAENETHFSKEMTGTITGLTEGFIFAKGDTLTLLDLRLTDMLSVIDDSIEFI